MAVLPLIGGGHGQDQLGSCHCGRAVGGRGAERVRLRVLRRGDEERHGGGDARSEEHTSELQSRFDLVCRLLLEKKKNENFLNAQVDYTTPIMERKYPTLYQLSSRPTLELHHMPGCFNTTGAKPMIPALPAVTIS